MAKQNGKFGNKGIHNLRSAGWQAAKLTGRATDKTATSLFRWVTTDHSGIGKALQNMPSMGFFNTLRYILMKSLIALTCAVLTGVLVFLLIAYGIPYLIMGHF
ncbi:hypothetical protein [Sulfurirhabdus autotrophica]|uniref:Uncharacterized protein n=1 Tax=Sulfurirhabdus autotrophica TaxID=1706046 RepID=A0A4R3Y4F6_9PROT|nr:hypothetical protein [Sulfurirhabdus autotrophica]TCV86646.1 hypothetical protein EDC63_1067 [Sulfurirhabdus autotrophica]